MTTEPLKQMRCGDCVHWAEWTRHADNIRVGSCPALTAKGGFSDHCRVYDDSDPITTEINFGCIHFLPTNLP